MYSKSLEKIDLCGGCFKNKAEYLFLKSTFFWLKIRFFCKDCAKEQAEKEGLGII